MDDILGNLLMYKIVQSYCNGTSYEKWDKPCEIQELQMILVEFQFSIRGIEEQ